ncbi:MAG: hypothetical protein R3D98_05265 [Candidatus Krumholzibacteriia bacterium]
MTIDVDVSDDPEQDAPIVVAANPPEFLEALHLFRHALCLGIHDGRDVGRPRDPIASRRRPSGGGRMGDRQRDCGHGHGHDNGTAATASLSDLPAGGHAGVCDLIHR